MWNVPPLVLFVSNVNLSNRIKKESYIDMASVITSYSCNEIHHLACFWSFNVNMLTFSSHIQRCLCGLLLLNVFHWECEIMSLVEAPHVQSAAMT